MKRRDFMTLVASATVAWPFGGGGQEAGRNYRLGILWPFPYGTPESSLLADALRPYGFIDGKNLNIDCRCWAQHVDQIWDYAAEFVEEHVDAIATGGFKFRGRHTPVPRYTASCGPQPVGGQMRLFRSVRLLPQYQRTRVSGQT